MAGVPVCRQILLPVDAQLATSARLSERKCRYQFVFAANPTTAFQYFFSSTPNKTACKLHIGNLALPDVSVYLLKINKIVENTDATGAVFWKQCWI